MKFNKKEIEFFSNFDADVQPEKVVVGNEYCETEILKDNKDIFHYVFYFLNSDGTRLSSPAPKNSKSLSWNCLVSDLDFYLD